MDIKEYISSGILESYILGTASEQERREVECISSIYPEIRKELDTLSVSLEQYAQANAIEPPARVRDKIFAEIDALEKKGAKAEARVVTMESVRKPGTQFNYWLAAASVALLIISSVLFYQLSDKNSELSSSKQLAEQLQQEKSQSESSLEVMHKQMAMLNNPDNKKVMMKGTDAHPGMLASVLWNTQNHEVYLSVSNLPQPPADKQYQLWAIVDGKPVDMGVFDISADSAMYKKMGATQTAQAFAVTLENKGGSPVPTLTAMYVMGQI